MNPERVLWLADKKIQLINTPWSSASCSVFTRKWWSKHKSKRKKKKKFRSAYSACRLVLKKTVFLRGRVRWIWVWSTRLIWYVCRLCDMVLSWTPYPTGDKHTISTLLIYSACAYFASCSCVKAVFTVKWELMFLRLFLLVLASLVKFFRTNCKKKPGRLVKD